MARRLTKKQRGFVNDIADGMTGKDAALNNYDIKSHKDREETARALASQNLTKPAILEELKKLGFDSNNAKRVVAEILNDEGNEPRDRLKAAENVFKVHSDYAPEKHVNLNVNAEPSPRIRAIADRLVNRN